MKRNLLAVNDAVEVVIDGGVEDGVITALDTFTADVFTYDEDEDTDAVVKVAYKNITK